MDTEIYRENTTWQQRQRWKWCAYRQRTTKIASKQLKLARSKETPFLRILREKHSLANILISDFSPPELKDNTFLFFQVTQFAGLCYSCLRAALVAQTVKNLPAVQETQIRSLDQEDPLREGNSNPVQPSCLENSMDRGAWWATVSGVTKSWIWLGDTHTHQTFSYMPSNQCLSYKSPCFVNILPRNFFLEEK